MSVYIYSTPVTYSMLIVRINPLTYCLAKYIMDIGVDFIKQSKLQSLKWTVYSYIIMQFQLSVKKDARRLEENRCS